MVLRAALIWVLGLISVVPYGTYYLLFHAQRDQYAILITLVLFWIFGYWSVVGALLAALKIRSVARAIEQAHDKAQLLEAIRSKETADVAIGLIASENGIPRFLAAKVYRLLVRRLSVSETSRTN